VAQTQADRNAAHLADWMTIGAHEEEERQKREQKFMKWEAKALAAEKKQQADAEKGTANLPRELRNQIWNELLHLELAAKDGVFTELTTDDSTADTVTYLTMDDETGTVTKTKVGMSEYVVRPTSAAFFEQNLLKNPELFHEFFAEVSRKFIISFIDAGALERFAKDLEQRLWNRWGKEKTGVIRVACFAFNKFHNLAKWEEGRGAHGFDDNTGDHVVQWSRAIELLPDSVEAHFVLCFPWRDYRRLKKYSSRLREVSGVKVAALDRGWVNVKELHYDLTFASITDCTLPRLAGFSTAKSEALVMYGCRGCEDACGLK